MKGLDAWLTRDPSDRGEPVEYEEYYGVRAHAVHRCRNCKRISQWRSVWDVDGDYVYLCDEHYNKQNKGDKQNGTGSR